MMKKSKKVIIDILSIIIVIFCLAYIILAFIVFINESENAKIDLGTFLLSISILLSVFLAGAIYNLLRRD